ncbi:MAG: hypothetical protein M3151_14825, partial [Actinomycetota bacterium]|nr:hypothetical protein [Actinomycetota bacterium]
TPRLIVYGFLALMALGTVLLKLPASTESGISWLDAFFVSVSCGSVTGLSTVTIPTTFTPFGRVVMMVLVQLGGLGIMTVTTIAALLIGQRVGFRDLLAVREEMENVDSLRNTLRLLGQIAAITFAVELVGAAVLAAGFFRRGMGVGESAFQGIFHAVMAFCNAGFTILPGEGLFPYAGDWLIVATLVAVITLGGLGFPVLVDIYRYRDDRRLSVHSRLVLITSGVLVVVGVLSVALVEWTNPATLGGETASTRAAMSVFQGVTLRMAGFATVDYAEMRDPTLVVQALLTFIGTAPTSTGGGVKVTTIALVFLIVLSQVRGQDHALLARASAGAGCQGPRRPRALHGADRGRDPDDHDLRRARTAADPLRDHLRLRHHGPLPGRDAATLRLREDLRGGRDVPWPRRPYNVHHRDDRAPEAADVQVPAGGYSDRVELSAFSCQLLRTVMDKPGVAFLTECECSMETATLRAGLP